jgi:predicted Zn-dependent protease
MVYSDRMQHTEARQLLSRAVELDPGHANGQVALRIAALRDNDLDGAKGPLEKAVVLSPRNPFALRALGQLLLKKDNVPAALPHLRAAATVAPDDPINLFTYAQCLLPSRANPTRRKLVSCSRGPYGWPRWGSWPRRSRTSSAASPAGRCAPTPKACPAWMR